MKGNRSVRKFPIPPLPLRRLSRGRAGLAALVLVGAHVGVLMILVLIWLVGMAPIFGGVHWIFFVLASVVLVGGVLVTFMALAPWAVEYEDEFSFAAAFVLDRLHFYLLITTVVLGTLGAAMIAADARWYHLFPTAEIKGLHDRAVTMPIPADWSLEDAEERNNGFPADFYEYEQSFDVPQSYEFPDLVEWMSSSQWETSFGALQEIDCDADLQSCEAEVVPAQGDEVVYSVAASYRLSPIEGLPPSVRVSLEHLITQ